MAVVTATPNWRRIGILALGHGLNDAYVNFFAPLLPLIVARLGLSLEQAGFLGTLLFASSSLSQPLYGLLADRMRRSWFVALGPTLTVAAMSFLPVAPGYAGLAALLVVAGVGTAAFHPQSAALAGRFGGLRRSTALSAFVAAGELGYALGPLVVTGAVVALGPGRSPLVVLPGLAACAVLWRHAIAWPAAPARPRAHAVSLRPHLRFFAALWGYITITRVVNTAWLTFIAVLATQRAGTLVAGGVALFVYVGAGVVGGITGTVIAERVGRRAVMVGSQLFAMPFLYAYLRADGALSFVALAIAGASMVASGPAIVAMAQERVPERASVASSIVMGFAWGAASVAGILVGRVADRVGLETALTYLLVLLPLATPIVAALPAGRRGRRAEPAGAAAQ